jgi:hypothetical protein
LFALAWVANHKRQQQTEYGKRSSQVYPPFVPELCAASCVRIIDLSCVDG